MDAFATYSDLGTRIKRTFTADEQPWITTLLKDASTYLRDDVIGAQVFPQATSTVRFWPDGGRVDLPNPPLISIGTVARAGVTLVEDEDYTRRENMLWFSSDEPVDITFTYGYLLAPEALKRWTMVLVSQVLLPLEQKLGLTAGGLSSVQIDDFKVAFADAGEATGITLTDRNIALIRSRFGSDSAVVVTTR